MNIRNLLRWTVLIVAVTTAAFVHAQSTSPSPADIAKTNWVGSLAAGLTLTRGNSESSLITFTALAMRTWNSDELTAGANMTYGKSKDQATGVESRTADSYNAYIQNNWLLTDRWYAYGRVDALYDSLAGINYRVILSPGIGYYFIKEKTIDLSGEVGPSYVFQKLDGHAEDFATLRVGEKFHYQISAHSRFWETAEWLPRFENFGNYIVNAEVGVEADMTTRASIRVYAQDTFNSVPAPGRKQNDLKLIAAAAYKF